MAEPTTASRPGERLIRARTKTDAGLGLDERPLRPLNWFGFAFSWVLLSYAVVTFFESSMRIMRVGGFCAEGGAYEIAAQCRDNGGLIFGLSLPITAAAVLIGIFCARGFGVPAHGFFWSLLFGAGGVAFLIASVGAPHPVPLVRLFCGLLFLALAAPPVFLIRIAWPRTIFGRRRLNGQSLVKHGLPVRDASVVGLVWIAAVLLGIGGGLLVLGTFS